MESEPKLSQSELLEHGDGEQLRREQLLEESGEQGQEVGEESPEQKHQRELFAALNKYVFSFYDEEEKGLAMGAKKEIEHMGDVGVNLLLEGINSQQLRPYRAIEILSELNTEKSIQAMESLLADDVVTKDADRSSRIRLLKLLPTKDKPSSIPLIVDFTNRTLENLDKLIEARVDLMSEKESKELLFLMYDAQEAIGGLQKFTDREGFNRAEELYKKFNEARERVDALRKEQRGQLQEKLKTILGKPFELNLQEFPQATDEEAANIDRILGNFQSSLYWWQRENIEELAVFGNKALPFIYQAIKENRLTGHKAYRILTSQYSTEDTAPILSGLLLDSVGGSSHFFERDILNIISASGNPEAAKVIAEFVRKSAEEALRVEREEDRYTLRTSIEYGLRALARMKYNEEAKKLRKLLAFSYPEFSEGYEVLTLPSVERPKTKEQREWAHTKLYIRGSSLFAEMLGKGKNKVHDIDIFVTNSDAYATAETMKVANFNNVDDLENILQKEEIAKLKEWVEKHGYSGKPINLVRIPESHLRLEETFENEPKLLLWDQSLEGEMDINRYPAEQLQNYRDGNYIINSEFPERLVANGTLTRALRLMDLSERFGLEHDETILNQAEQLARNNKLVISNIPPNRLAEMQELNGSPIIDPTFIKVFNDKKLRKSLLRKFPRLGQISEEVAEVGGVENYIKQKYGEVYLATRGYIRLYDIDLSKSPADLDRQKEFVTMWYSELNQRDFMFDEVEKTSDNTGLAKLERLDQLVDMQRLERAKESRKGKNAFLDKVAGRYAIKVESRDSYEQRRKVELFLSVLNLEWPANMDMDKKRVSQTLIRLGVNPRNPILTQFDTAKKQEVELVISPIPEDILQASTDKPWSSCVRLDGGIYHLSTYEDIAGASVVAYLVKGDNYLARKFIRAGMTLDTFQPAAAIEVLYGDERYNEVMQTAIQKVLQDNGIKTGVPMLTYPFGSDGYFDLAVGQTREGNRFYHTRPTHY